MVFYFKSTVVDPPAFIYMGKDKEENEDLIQFGWERDFHVDNLSSAHVYLRLREGDSWSNIPEKLLEDCAQLTKANSIQGNKKENIVVIYTPWSNLRKDGSMATGQVSFHEHGLVKKCFVKVRENPIVNRLNKTKEEKYPDLRAEKEEVEKEQRKQERLKREAQKAKDREDKVQREQKKWEQDHAYDAWTDTAQMKSNDDYDSDDFM